MARFIAKHPRYRHGVRTGRFMVLQDGQRQELTKELFARFDVSVVTPEEQNVGIRDFNHHGLPEDRDTNELFSPRNRISGFDSEQAQQMLGWTDEERTIVETVLRNSPMYGDEFFEILQAKAEKPWPTYDETPVEDIFMIAVAIGLDLTEVARYESENLAREKVLTALEGEAEVTDDDVLIEA